MKKKRDKRIIPAVLTVLFDAMAIFITLYFLANKDVEKMVPAHVLNIGMDMAGMMIGIVILICSYIDMQRGASDNRYFRYMIQSTFFGLITDAGAWLMNGAPAYRGMNLFENTVYYLVTPLNVYFFWRFLLQLTRIRGTFVKVINMIISIWATVQVLLCLYNIPTGIFFTIDENSYYVRGPLYVYFMSFIFVVGIAAALLIIHQRKMLNKQQIAVCLIYICTPLPVIGISVFLPDINANFVMTMIDLLIMYVVLNIEQGRLKMEMEKDLATASSIQAGVLPSTFPLFPERKEFDVHASMDPAKEVGGDFYDVFMTDEDHLMLVVGDVAGKGIPAALFMLLARTIIKNRAQIGGTPAQILKDVNVQIFEENKAKMFVTIWMAVVELSTGHVAEVNAGHECPAIKRNGGDFELIKEKHDFVVGGRKKTVFHDKEYDLTPGDKIFIYTDGVPEASNGKKEMYGTERMIAALNAYEDERPEDLLTHVRENIDAFVGDADQFDDLTMLAFVYNGPIN